RRARGTARRRPTPSRRPSRCGRRASGAGTPRRRAWSAPRRRAPGAPDRPRARPESPAPARSETLQAMRTTFGTEPCLRSRVREDEADMARTALITGATGGLGGAVVDRFAREGWSVLGVDKVPSEDRENVRFVEADLFDEEQVSHAVAQAGPELQA